MVFLVGYLVGAVLFFVLCAYLSARKIIYEFDAFGIVFLTSMWPFATFMFALSYLVIGVGKVYDSLINYFSESK